MSFTFKSFAVAAVVGLGLAGCVENQPTTGLNRNVVIENQTGQTIWRFYGSRVSTNSWEEDILGSSVLPNGDAVNIDFDDGTGSCRFDMRAEFQDGNAVEQYDIDVCTASRVTFR